MYTDTYTVDGCISEWCLRFYNITLAKGIVFESKTKHR